MANKTNSIETMLLKLQVLDSKIQRIKSLTDGLLEEVNTNYQTQIEELVHKKETIQQLLSNAQNAEKN